MSSSLSAVLIWHGLPEGCRPAVPDQVGTEMVSVSLSGTEASD